MKKKQEQQEPRRSARLARKELRKFKENFKNKLQIVTPECKKWDEIKAADDDLVSEVSYVPPSNTGHFWSSMWTSVCNFFTQSSVTARPVTARPVTVRIMSSQELILLDMAGCKCPRTKVHEQTSLAEVQCTCTRLGDLCVSPNWLGRWNDASGAWRLRD